MNEIEMAKVRKAAERADAGGYRRGGLSAFRLKVIGAVFMALSVASVTLVPLIFGVPTADNMTSLTVAVVCEIASWCAVPIYAWLLFDGWRHTRNRWRYWAQLFVAASVAGLPYDKIMTGQWFDARTHNPMWGLVFAYIVLVAVDWIGRKYAGAARWTLTALVIVAGVLWNLLLRIGVSQQVMYSGVITLAFVMVFYFLNQHENTMMFTAGLLGAVSCITPGIGVAFLHYRNGRLGYARPWTKWVFYALYPAMLLAGALLV
ncbi:TraX family protein [Bifidobacterium biavatii]|uniref:Putative ABC transport system membrane protein n=1 Tax=Bifidobacterium biavatii DSM 23969 TaxID=1437608 RepID=A0A086ZND3_9BIFI|nr:TraX family protein [Bifidobacterium biavatii]KFI48033.1 putative ABC transport system membrane protein [Bifidobacterium biavatii DSM 23969]